MQFLKELIENKALGDRAVVVAQNLDSSLIAPEEIIEAARHNSQLNDALRGILTPRHPSQLYEAFFEGIVLFAILCFVRTRMRQPNGFLTGLYFIFYAILRIFVENFREPDASLIGGFNRGRVFFFFLIAG